MVAQRSQATPGTAFHHIQLNLKQCIAPHPDHVAGLLEGAHEGRGLGHEFLRHCQRARMLVHVIDGSSPDPLGDFHAIQTELQLFNQELTNKPQVIFLHANSYSSRGLKSEQKRMVVVIYAL